MFAEESKKVFTNVCLQRFVVGWVKPNNIAFLIFLNVFIIFTIFSLLLISYFFIISTAGETLLITWCCFNNCKKRFSMDCGSCWLIDGG